MTRIHWDALPDGARDAIETHTGPVLKAESVSAGRNSDVAALLHTHTSHVFIKGTRDNPRRARTQNTEAAINPYVRPLGPQLLWHVDTDGWNILGFEHIAGRHADLSPGSPDLPKIAEALRQLATIPCPDLPLKQLAQRSAGFVDEPDSELLSGEHLLHTDLRPDNLLIADTARFIDWAWASSGPAWADAGYLVIQLIDNGHTPEQAETWAEQLPSWLAAPTDALDTFALANSRMWEQIAHDDPQPWKRHLAATTRRWTRHRLPAQLRTR